MEPLANERACFTTTRPENDHMWLTRGEELDKRFTPVHEWQSE
jgi:hypothetical protein